MALLLFELADKEDKRFQPAAGGRTALFIERGSTVRVRQRALQKRRYSGLRRMCSVGVGASEGLDGAVYGAFASRRR